LRGFRNPSSGNLWVYPKGLLEVRRSSSENEGHQKYYYAFFDTNGKRHTNTIEDFFSVIGSPPSLLNFWLMFSIMLHTDWKKNTKNATTILTNSANHVTRPGGKKNGMEMK